MTSKEVFENLIEASSRRNLGENIEFEGAKASSISNAAGILHQMSFDEAGQRAMKFGRRFKVMATKACV